MTCDTISSTGLRAAIKCRARQIGSLFFRPVCSWTTQELSKPNAVDAKPIDHHLAQTHELAKWKLRHTENAAPAAATAFSKIKMKVESPVHDVQAATVSVSSTRGTSTPPVTTKGKSSASVSPKKLKRSKKKTLTKQVRELQATVNALQGQVNDAAAQIQQIKQLVAVYIQSRKQLGGCQASQETKQLEPYEMEISIDEQQRRLRTRIKREYEQHLHQQRVHQLQVQLQQQCLKTEQSPLRQDKVTK